MARISELVRNLLEKRGIQEKDFEAFLSPDYARDTHDPFLLHDMERAVARVFAAMEQKEKIAVYSDFDCDGIPGAALLYDFFQKIGYSNVEVYIPHRDREGYGFHIAAIEQLAERRVSLVITVDVGTTAIETVKRAKELGIDVIITDHHEQTNGLPDALAVINPKLGAYPFRNLCGAAVAWKLVCALLVEGRKQELPAFSTIPEGWEKWLLDLVAIATIADLVPLREENRTLTHFGLKVLHKSPRLGVKALCALTRLRQSEITEDDVAFSFAPRINAASRMDEPEIAFKLLTTNDERQARVCAARLEELNAERKGVVAGLVRQARKTARARFGGSEKVIAFGNPEWKPALLGLAANSIVEERGGVVCLWGRDAAGRIKGSCRSDGSISVIELFSNARQAFEEFGGHAYSGGFTVSHSNVHTLHEVLATASTSLAHATNEEKERGHDVLITLSEVAPALLGEVSRLAPFGIGNPKPVFLISSVTVSSVRRFGRDNHHVEVIVSCERTGVSIRAFDFFKSPENFTHAPTLLAPVQLLATLQRDSFRGGVSLRLLDILALQS